MKGETIARAWALARADGLVLGFTDHDRALRFEGISFRPDAGLSARAVVQGAGLSVDNTEAVGALSDSAITESDLMAGRWDSADVRLWEVDWSDVANRSLIFRGHLGEVSRSGGAFRAELRGLSEPLNQTQGRVYHPRCSAELGDAKCRFDLSATGYSAEGLVQETDGQRLVLTGIAGHYAGWFERGQLVVLSGQAAGLRGLIKVDLASPAGRELGLWTSLGLHPKVGDRIRLIAGCDKRPQTCRMKFLNYLNFRGFPHLPPEDWLIAPKVNR
ncbi:DUF2163 domain-containing protein [Paracoccus laeviglucosivorans]|uniref:Bacteriophage phiJL001 Gp84 C-terminal domain-containing protein n=1 Tax=Paracoccus laeviglucosivorans TaxID=1197861 RepID=A0A521CHV1_9RHOB|nr:DUF2163 domain-containing protein [Paracoccus laeviglucosivorans]SMO59019.1 phage conserved hypothetical protein BR0599 [Paracoccus laeviglucosivorans]